MSHVLIPLSHVLTHRSHVLTPLSHVLSSPEPCAHGPRTEPCAHPPHTHALESWGFRMDSTRVRMAGNTTSQTASPPSFGFPGTRIITLCSGSIQIGRSTGRRCRTLCSRRAKTGYSRSSSAQSPLRRAMCSPMRAMCPHHPLSHVLTSLRATCSPPLRAMCSPI